MPSKKNQLEQAKRVKILVQLLKSEQLTQTEIADLHWEYNFLLYQTRSNVLFFVPVFSATHMTSD